jgi:hypothetical protein
MRAPSHRIHPLSRPAAASGLLALLGAWIAQGASIFKAPADPTIPLNSDFYLYTFTRFEPLALYASAAFFIGVWLFLKREPAPSRNDLCLLTSKNLPLWLALGTLALTAIGRFAVDQNFDLCVDEYLNEFEVQIMDQHHLVAVVSPEWRDYHSALKVPYQIYNPQEHYWASGFLPGFAFLDYIFSKADFSWALSPVLAAISILLLSGVARRIFSEDPVLAGNLAILLLAFSPQFLAMAMTKFAWTAHLCGALLWVWLYIHPNRILFFLTPILGAMLIGIHQPHVHPLVAAPFVLRLAYTGRWKIFAWFAGWYLAGAWTWYQVFCLLRPPAFASGGDLNNLALPTAVSIIPVLLSLIFATFHAVTLGFYLFFPHPQGHGWGFRYLHAAYGFLALAAAAGAKTLFHGEWSRQASQVLLASLAISLFIQVPYRAYEIRTMVQPLATTWNYISKQRCDFVIIETSQFWYSWDLVRNDPWLKRRPLIFNGDELTPQQRQELSRKGTVRVVGANEVRNFGVILSDPSKTPTH